MVQHMVFLDLLAPFKALWALLLEIFVVVYSSLLADCFRL